MELTLSMVGVGGDARLSFTKDHIRVNWGETSRRERRMITSLVAKARKAKFTVVTVDADGKADKPARWRDLPGIFGQEGGQVLLQGRMDAIMDIARAITEEEIKEPLNIVSEAQKDGTWKVVKEATVPKEGEKKELVVKPVLGGG